MACDSLAHELATRGHRLFCHSPYRDEPPRPRDVIAEQWRKEAALYEAKATALRLRADRLDAGDETAREGTLA